MFYLMSREMPDGEARHGLVSRDFSRDTSSNKKACNIKKENIKQRPISAMPGSVAVFLYVTIRILLFFGNTRGSVPFSA